MLATATIGASVVGEGPATPTAEDDGGGGGTGSGATIDVALL